MRKTHVQRKFTLVAGCALHPPPSTPPPLPAPQPRILRLNLLPKTSPLMNHSRKHLFKITERLGGALARGAREDWPSELPFTETPVCKLTFRQNH